MKRRKRSALLKKINSRTDTLDTIKEAALAFYILAAVQLIIALIASTSVWVDAVLYALIAFWLGKFHSRLAAVILLVLAIAVFVTTLTNVPGASVQGRNPLLGLFMVWTSSRAVEATFKLHGQFAAGEEST